MQKRRNEKEVATPSGRLLSRVGQLLGVVFYFSNESSWVPDNRIENMELSLSIDLGSPWKMSVPLNGVDSQSPPGKGGVAILLK